MEPTLPLTESSCAKTTFAFFAVALLGGCTQAAVPLSMASDDQACMRTMAVLAANGTYQPEQMAGCEGGKADESSRFNVLRVNGLCRDPQGCGSVLMGWYAVDSSTGAVYEWDVTEQKPGQRIDRKQ